VILLSSHIEKFSQFTTVDIGAVKIGRRLLLVNGLMSLLDFTNDEVDGTIVTSL
jgi:hypothetical protein